MIGEIKVMRLTMMRDRIMFEHIFILMNAHAETDNGILAIIFNRVARACKNMRETKKSVCSLTYKQNMTHKSFYNRFSGQQFSRSQNVGKALSFVTSNCYF